MYTHWKLSVYFFRKMLVSLQLHSCPCTTVSTLKWNPLIEHNEQSAFCNITCYILKKVLAVNPYNSQAWLTHGGHSIMNCVKFFFFRYCQYCASDNFFKVILKAWCYKCCTQMIVTWHQTKWMNSPQRRTELFSPQKCYITWSLNFWLYGWLLEEPAFILLMT
jgi:hypothetical protein